MKGGVAEAGDLVGSQLKAETLVQRVFQAHENNGRTFLARHIQSNFVVLSPWGVASFPNALRETVRKIFSWAIGLALAVGGRFEAGEILTVVGLASLPDDLKTWRHWLILAASHFALWVPFAIGFAIILLANWERATIALTKDRRSRKFRRH